MEFPVVPAAKKVGGAIIHMDTAGYDSPINIWLTRLIMAGFFLLELASTAWIIYKIISPKY